MSSLSGFNAPPGIGSYEKDTTDEIARNSSAPALQQSLPEKGNPFQDTYRIGKVAANCFLTTEHRLGHLQRNEQASKSPATEMPTAGDRPFFGDFLWTIKESLPAAGRNRRIQAFALERCTKPI